MAGSDKSQNRTWEPDGSGIASWLHEAEKKNVRAGRELVMIRIGRLRNASAFAMVLQERAVERVRKSQVEG